MSITQAVLWLDHHRAELLSLSSGVPARRLQAHAHATAQHHAEVRDQHEFFATVCAALDDVEQALLTGGHQATADFVRYVHKHRPATAARIAASEIVDHPSERQLLALGRDHFDRAARGLAPAPDR